MIFQHTCEWVLDVSPHTGKRKTQTRHPAKLSDAVFARWPYAGYAIQLGGENQLRLREAACEIVVVCSNGKVRWMIGRDYAIQPGRGKVQVGRFELAAIRYDPIVADISEEDAHAEGFASPADFLDVWRGMYGEAALERDCWALEIGRAWRV